MSLPTADPAGVGLDPGRLAVADAHVRSGAEEDVYTAAVLLVCRHAAVAHAAAFGTLGHDDRPTAVDTVFDLASVTKPHVAATLLRLVEDGLASLAQPLAEVLPEAAHSPAAGVTVRQLATHVSGLPAWRALYQAGEGHDAMLAEILRTPLHHPPGTHYAYSDLGYMLLGEVIARAAGEPLQDAVRRLVLAPLGMDETGYLPDPGLRDRIAATANCPMRQGQTLVGAVHDANAHFYGGVAGHAGLFGTAPDLAMFAAALATDGGAAGRRLFGLPTLRLARTNQADATVGGHSIGWFTPPNTMLPRGDILGDATFGHTGFTGTMIVVEPALALAVVLLTNRVVNPADATRMAQIRRRVLNAVASAVVG